MCSSPWGCRNRVWWRSALFCFLAVLLLGCSSRTAEEVAEERAHVLGTWEYRTQGMSALHRGTFRIVEEDGHLTARLRDNWRGEVQVQVSLQGRQMELTLNRLRIAGRLDDNRFVGYVQTPYWDASRSRLRRQKYPGRLVAQRIRRGSGGPDRTEYGCPSLLRESSYTCSPLRPSP